MIGWRAITAGAAIIVVAATAGYEIFRDPLILRLCEAYARESLRAPDTYKRQSLDDTAGAATVHLGFTAANGYGVPVRGSINCVFSDEREPDGMPRISAVLINGRPIDMATEILARRHVERW